MRRVVGVDISMTCTGIVSITEGSPEVKIATVESSGHKGDTITTKALRLTDIARQIEAEIGYPDLVVVEGPSFAAKGSAVHDIAGLWWLTMAPMLVVEPVSKVAIAPPSSLKKFATGSGTAAKSKVIDAVARRWPEVETGGDDNVADALVLAKMGVHHLGITSETMPKVHLLGLDGVNWPE